MLGPASPFFIKADLQNAIRFYTQTLGFELRHTSPDSDPFFAIVGLGTAQIMLKEIDPNTPPLPNSKHHPWAQWDAFVHTADPQGFANTLPTGTSVDQTDDGLLGFQITDADGYVLYFGRPA